MPLEVWRLEKVIDKGNSTFIVHRGENGAIRVIHIKIIDEKGRGIQRMARTRVWIWDGDFRLVVDEVYC